MDELTKLFNELKNMSAPKVLNTSEVWRHIGKKDWASAGFTSEEEAIAWIQENPYLNL